MSEFEIEAGDLVVPIVDVNEVKRLQDGHGGWIDAMKLVSFEGSYALYNSRLILSCNPVLFASQCLGKSGMVKKADSERAVVEINGKSYCWNKKALRLAAKSRE